jgi:hypothetical protein
MRKLNKQEDSMKKDIKKAKKNRKKITVKDLKPKANSQVEGGSSVQRAAEIDVSGYSKPSGSEPR